MTDGYEKLLIGDETKEVEIDGQKFVLKLPSWMELERCRDKATTINGQTGQIHLDQAKHKMTVLLACIKESPFPDGTPLEACISKLKPHVFNELMRNITEMQMEIQDDSKN